MRIKHILPFVSILLGVQIINAQLPNMRPIPIVESAPEAPKKGESAPEIQHFFLFGSATINTTAALTESLTGTQKFAARYIIFPYNADYFCAWRSLNATISINTLNLRPTGVSVDSIDFISFMFPETGNAGFIFGPEFTYLQKRNTNMLHKLSWEASLALRQNKVNNVNITDSTGTIIGSETIDFSLININVTPLKYTLHYEKEDITTWLSASVYGHYFNVPNEDAANFNKIFEETVFTNTDGSNSRIYAIGGKISGGINGFEFYADMRNNFTPKTLSNENPYKGFVFNAGFATNLVIFSR